MRGKNVTNAEFQKKKKKNSPALAGEPAISSQFVIYSLIIAWMHLLSVTSLLITAIIKEVDSLLVMINFPMV